MSIWSKIFGQKSVWLLSCPLCKTNYRLGVDAYLVTRDDVMRWAGQATTIVGNLKNTLFSGDAVYFIEGKPSENDQAVLRETKRKMREIEIAIAIGEPRRWFCRKCGGPEKGEHPYPIQIDASPEIARLTLDLTSNDPQTRWDAIRELGRMKDPRVLGPLVASLADDLTKYDAQEAITKSNDPRIVESLSRVLASDHYFPKHRAAAAETLGALKHPDAVEPLARALGDEKELVRESAAKALAEAGSVEVLIKSLNSAKQNVREAAAYAIGSTGDRRVVGPLIARLNDQHGLVRRNAAGSLGYFHSPEVIDALVGSLNDAESCVRDWAVNSLGRIGDKAATIPLMSALTDRSWSVRYAACKALGGLGDVRAVDALIVALRDQEDLVKKTAAIALAELADPRGVVALREQGLEVTDTKAATAQRLNKIQCLTLEGDLLRLRDVLHGQDEQE